MRQFLLNEALDEKGLVTVTGKDVKYLTKVLRLTCGDTFPARLRGGALCTMRIEHKDGAKLVLRCVDGARGAVHGADVENARSNVDYAARVGNCVQVGVPGATADGADVENARSNVDYAAHGNARSNVDYAAHENARSNVDYAARGGNCVQVGANGATADGGQGAPTATTGGALSLSMHLQSGSSMTGGVRAELVQQSVRAPRIWLLQCLPRAAKFDTIIRQATECGVERIFPVLSDRSVQEGACGSAKRERWNRIVREARQQSASAVETTVAPPLPMTEALQELARCAAALEGETARDCNGEQASAALGVTGAPGEQTSAAARVQTGAGSGNGCGKTTGANDIRLVLTEMPQSPLERKTLHGYLTNACKAVVLAVGSEGGISAAEYELLRANGFLPLHFETNILRTETAAIYGIAAVQTLLTEFHSWQSNE